jgi:hypothetical protein
MITQLGIRKLIVSGILWVKFMMQLEAKVDLHSYYYPARDEVTSNT